MDTVSIVFFLIGELHRISCCGIYWKCLFVWKNQEENLHYRWSGVWDNIMWKESNKPYGAKFGEHLVESLLRLGFKKTKHDSVLWMIDKTSHYEYLATHVDAILMWSKDSMVVSIMSFLSL
jgi:hypothetical protein